MTAASIYLDTNVIIAVMEAPPSDDTGIQNLWQADVHPLFRDVRLSPVKIVRPDPSSLFDLIQALS